MFSEIFIKEDCKPSGRKGHQLILVGSQIYLMGGENSEGKKNMEVLIYSIDLNRWMIEDSKGQIPMMMSYFRCVLTSNQFILCVGGEMANGKLSNKLYSFNYLDNIWVQIETVGLNSARTKFGLIFFREQLYLFGGSFYDQDN